MGGGRGSVGLGRDGGGVTASRTSYDGMTMASGMRVSANNERHVAIKNVA